MSKPFKDMTKEELESYIDKNQNSENIEEAFLEFSSRLNWNKVPKSASPEQTKQIIEDLIAERTQK